jgi:hypothetical protein
LHVHVTVVDESWAPVTLSQVTDLTPAVRELFAEAVAAASAKRGGRALLHDIGRDGLSDDLASTLVRQGALWQERDSDSVIGLCVCRERVIEALYVVPARRRRRAGAGRSARRDHPANDDNRRG